MKAIAYASYGPPDVLECREIEKPVPGADEVMLRVRAASVNPVDWHFMRGTPYPLRIATGLRRPKNPRLGTDVAGRVEAVGRNVAELRPGDEVFGSCRGSLAEYVCASASALVTKPENLTFEQAGSVSVAALTALQGLRDKGRIQPGQKVLINGAAGGVGTFAVQIARSFGADVTGVCSTKNAEMVRSIGADRVIDYTREDFTTGTARYDVILDCVGNHSFTARRRALKRHGICVMVGAPNGGPWIGPLAGAVKTLLLSKFVSQSFIGFVAKSTPGDLTFLRELLEAGKVTPVIDRCYALSDAADAVRHLEAGHARGKVVVTVGSA